MFYIFVPFFACPKNGTKKGHPRLCSLPICLHKNPGTLWYSSTL